MMTVSRRSAILALGAGSLSAPLAAASEPRNVQSPQGLAIAVEALRIAMLEGDGLALDRLLHDHLVYMHSSGHSQTKARLLSDLAAKQFFAGLTHAEQSMEAVDHNGLVRLTVDQVKNIANGQTRASRIKVLQVWTIGHFGWQLLARSSAIVSSPLQRACAQG